eukprot:TRINITY_DN4767_c0_g1_i7.p4 TRINITY_DN4767_c0_g1~~TRINITY_DN4767_c0_g1_i7.p4  ORF type:complete len:101 (+),score=33.49 TRINITY_DN4767_c0_g1_i7:398-700(+)
MKKVKLAVIGAGSRGAGYAEFAEKYPDRLEIVAVAEPREYNRGQMVEKYHIPEENVFSDWKEFVEKEKIADGVIIATQDNMHTEPAVACARKGYLSLIHI